MEPVIIELEEEKFKRLLIKNFLDKLGFDGEEIYFLMISVNEKIKKHRSKYVNDVGSITYAPSFKKSSDDIPLYRDSPGGCKPLHSDTLREIMDLLDVLGEILDFNKIRKNYSVYNKIEKSNLLERSELNEIKFLLSSDCFKY